MAHIHWGSDTRDTSDSSCCCRTSQGRHGGAGGGDGPRASPAARRSPAPSCSGGTGRLACLPQASGGPGSPGEEAWHGRVLRPCRGGAMLGQRERARTSPRYATPRQEARHDVRDDIERGSHSGRTPSYWGDGNPNAYKTCGQVASRSVHLYLTGTIP
jgi:hypothetical protein